MNSSCPAAGSVGAPFVPAFPPLAQASLPTPTATKTRCLLLDFPLVLAIFRVDNTHCLAHTMQSAVRAHFMEVEDSGLQRVRGRVMRHDDRSGTVLPHSPGNGPQFAAASMWCQTSPSHNQNPCTASFLQHPVHPVNASGVTMGTWQGTDMAFSVGCVVKVGVGCQNIAPHRVLYCARLRPPGLYQRVATSLGS